MGCRRSLQPYFSLGWKMQSTNSPTRRFLKVYHCVCFHFICSISWIFFSFLLDSLKKRWSRSIRIDVHSGWLVEYWYDVSFFCVFAYFLPWPYQSMALYLWYTIWRFSSGGTNCPWGVTHGQRTSKKCKMISFAVSVTCFNKQYSQLIYFFSLRGYPLWWTQRFTSCIDSLISLFRIWKTN